MNNKVIGGILLLAMGFLFFAHVAPEWQQAQSPLAQVGAAFSPRLQQQIEQTRYQYYFAIAIMGAGGLLILLGLHGPGGRP